MESTRRSAWNFHTGNQFTFGPEAHAGLGSLIHRQQARRVLLIADPQLEEYGVLQKVRHVLNHADCLYDVYLDPHLQPTTNQVDDAAAVAACFEPALIIALGGWQHAGSGQSQLCGRHPRLRSATAVWR